jgi:hypothetical protein
METWIDLYADSLGLERLTDEEITELLDLARDVAHGTERRFAPLATFLAGLAAGRDKERRAEIDDAVGKAHSLLDG